MSRQIAKLGIIGLFSLTIITAGAATVPPPTKKPQPTISRAEAVNYIQVQAKLNPDAGWSVNDFDTEFGKKDSYTLAEFKKYQPQSAKPKPSPGIPVFPSMGANSPRFLGPKIRASYTDALALEDPTLSKNPGAVKDLTGAVFSYTRDFIAESNAWVAKGAVLMPFAYSYDVNGIDLELRKYGVIPSVSFDREFNDSDPKKNVDSLIFRVGAYAGWTGVGPLDSLTVRLFSTYGTDFEFKSQVPAGEFELEPTYSHSSVFGIGRYVSLLSAKSPSPEDPNRVETTFGYSLRLILHGQGGEVNDNGDQTSIPERGFFRMGPKMQLRLDPIFIKQLTCTISYEYLANLAGYTANNDFLTIAPELVFNKPKEDATSLTAPLISLKANYQVGGIDLTKQRVQTFLVGLGITY